MQSFAAIVTLTTLNGLAAAGSALLAGVAWRRRRTAGVMAAGLTVAMIAASVWAASDVVVAMALLGHLSQGVGETAAVTIVPVSAVMVAGFWCLCRPLTHPGRPVTRRTVLICVVGPLVMTVAAATNPWHRALLRFPATEPDDTWLQMDPQWLFWAHITGMYVVLTAIVLTLIRGIRDAGHLQRRQVQWILSGALVPLAVNVLTLRYAGELPDVTALAFVITTLFIYHAVFRAGLLRLLPVARGLVFDWLQDAVVVADADGRLVDLNRAGSKLVKEAAPGLPRKLDVPIGAALSSLGLTGELTAGEHRVQLPTGLRVFDIGIERLSDHRGRLTASVVLIRDVTDLAAQRDALVRNNHQLREQVETIELLRKKLSEQALKDELTGLYNRRHLIAAMELHLDAAALNGTDVCAVLLDVDHFKSVNDRHGHAVGDDLLRGIADAIAEVVTEPAIVTRYGGEEFVLLLPDTDLPSARTQAEAIRHNCAAVVVATVDGPVSRTVSMGIASLHSLRRSREWSTEPLASTHLLKAADTDLYQAKAAGRDQVVCLDPDDARDFAGGR
ncbi:histidine kinase N-terminal 7TM domain-containing diguanylate cyclase [Actinoplanes xinjiangensis]|uniref:histidine kinase N-terminal 7TM domain-containing diguanylate cyclase n=1 Tax=Actinoplanes xinjiangensis TaxID=512350 RepID=UPI0034200D6E